MVLPALPLQKDQGNRATLVAKVHARVHFCSPATRKLSAWLFHLRGSKSLKS